MEHTRGPDGVEDPPDRRAIAHVRLVHPKVRAEGRQAPWVGAGPCQEVHLVDIDDQPGRQVGADETRAAGHERTSHQYNVR